MKIRLCYPAPGFLHLWLLPSCEISSRSPWFAKRVVTNLSDVSRRNFCLHSQRPHAFFLTAASQCFQLARFANFPTSLSLYSCVTMERKSSVRSACCSCTLLRMLSRVAKLAFLSQNSRNLAFFIVVWHEKTVFGICVAVWHFFGLFYGVGMKTHCLAFFKTSGSVTAVDLESYNFFSGQRSSLFCHGRILEDISGSAV